jgi:hypothetical protein
VVWLLAPEKIRLDVHLENIATQALDGVIEGKNVYVPAISNVKTLVNIHKIAKLDA